MHEKRQSSTKVNYTVAIWLNNNTRYDKCRIELGNIGINYHKVNNKTQSDWITLVVL